MKPITRKPGKREDDPVHWSFDRFSWLFYVVVTVAFGALTIIDFADGKGVLGWGYAVLTFSWATFLLQRKLWHRMGYRAGRYAAVAAAQEARDRGIDIRDWITSEHERALGITYTSGSTE
jgi:hypothetical protein